MSNAATVFQPSPSIRSPSRPLARSSSDFGPRSGFVPKSPWPRPRSVSSVTLAPLGGVKSNVEASGRSKLTLVKPTSTTAEPPLDGVSVNFSGMPVSLSTAMLTAPTVDPDCLGSTTSR